MGVDAANERLLDDTAYVQGEVDRANVVDDLFQDVRDGKRRLCTSVLSIVEVAYTATESGATDDDVASIDQLWTPASPVVLVDMSETLGRRARALVRRERGRAWPHPTGRLAPGEIRKQSESRGPPAER